MRAGLAAVGLLAVTAAGERQPGTGANNRRAALKAAGHLDIPAALGTPEPVALAPDLARATFMHGGYGLGAAPVKATGEA